jgi:hypothetical protein
VTRKNLIFMRGGDESLHPLWLAQKGVERTWDLHVSYFGKNEAPAMAGSEGVSFTKDEAIFKWAGMRVCLEKKPFDLDAYEYIAYPDDDVVVTTEGWNRVFELMRQYDLHAAQLSLHPYSDYTINQTLQRPGLLLRYVSCIECMVPVSRVSVFKHAAQYFDDPGSSWGTDYVIGHHLKHIPKSMAILDAVPALHTRAHGISAMYKDMTSGGLDYYEMEARFLAKLGLSRIPRQTLGAIDLEGNEVADLTWVKKPLFLPRALRITRKLRKVDRFLRISDPPEKLDQAMRWVAPRAI